MRTLGRRYQLASYALCIVLVVGAIGPWFTEPVSYQGIGEGGVIVIFGAILAAGFLTKVTSNTPSPWLLGVLVAACLCAVISGGAIVRFLAARESFVAVQIGALLTFPWVT